MALPDLALTVVLQRSPLDARRGIVRVHPTVLDVLGAAPWAPLALTGRRTTAAMAATAPPETPTGHILMNNITCTNAGVEAGGTVSVAPAVPAAGTAVKLTDLPQGGVLEPETVRLALLGKVVTNGDLVSLLPQDFSRPIGSGAHLDRLIQTLTAAFGGSWQEVTATVSSTSPAGPVRVTMETQVLLGDDAVTTGSSTPVGEHRTAPTRDDLPGLEEQFDRLLGLFELSFHHTALLGRLGASPQLGVLVTGPPGSGKGALVASVAAASGAHLHRIWAPPLARLEPTTAGAQLSALITEAQASPPSVVMIEDVEAIAPRNDAGPLLDVLRELATAAVRAERVAVVCTTAHPGETSPLLRHPGVLDHEIEIGLPTRDDRRRILAVQTRSLPLSADVDLTNVAAATPGFVAADLLALCREASLRAAQRVAADVRLAQFVVAVDFAAALEVVTPSALDGLRVEVADIVLEEVGDMEPVKRELIEAVIWPLRYPDTFDRLGVEPARGVLLFGPPGCGKTFLVKALVNEADANFLSVKGAELLSKWVGESERGVRELFRRARSSAPALILFDEIDALAPIRGSGHDSGSTDRVVAQLLTELDGVEDLHGVFVIGATNRPELVDPALLRPGRLERLVYVPPPDAGAERPSCPRPLAVWPWNPV